MFIIMPDLLAILIYGPRSGLNLRRLINATHARRAVDFTARSSLTVDYSLIKTKTIV